MKSNASWIWKEKQMMADIKFDEGISHESIKQVRENVIS